MATVRYSRALRTIPSLIAACLADLAAADEIAGLFGQNDRLPEREV